MREAPTHLFPLPNEICMLELSPGEIAVYAYLLYREDRKTFRCYPSYTTIAKALHISRNTVCKYVDKLREKSLIDTEQTTVFTKDGKRRNGNLMYTIRLINDAVELQFQKKLARVEKEQVNQRMIDRWEKMQKKKRRKRRELRCSRKHDVLSDGENKHRLWLYADRKNDGVLPSALITGGSPNPLDLLEKPYFL